MKNIWQKFLTFNHVFQKSLFSFAYYRDVVKAKFSFSFKYFCFFSSFLGLLLTISLSVFVIPQVNNFTNRVKTRAYSLFPQDLTITLKNGELSTNVQEPLKFPIPFELFTDSPPAISDQKQTYLLTIDTASSTSAYEKSQSLILLTKTESVIADSNGTYHTDTLKNFQDMTIDKKFVDNILDKILPVMKFLPLILIFVFLLVFIIALPLSRLVSLIFLSALLLIPVKIMKLDLGYKKLYQIGLHALTLPTMIQLFMLSFGIMPAMPFFSSILYLLYVLVILSKFKEKSVEIKKIK